MVSMVFVVLVLVVPVLLLLVFVMLVVLLGVTTAVAPPWRLLPLQTRFVC